MKTLYLECGMGAAGDMLTAALAELFPDLTEVTDRLNALGIPGVVFSAEPTIKCGISGTHMKVTVEGKEELHDMHEHSHDSNHHHKHRGLADVEAVINGLCYVSDKVKKDALCVFRMIAEAESQVHGIPVPEIHFHEVGTMDAVADVTAVCYLMAELAPDEVIASPVHTGSGFVRCAHGTLPVPAPATAYILQGVPSCTGSIMGELCTPTGAALIKHFADRFGEMPVMRVSAIGYGMGAKNFETANCLRAMIGESEWGTDTVTELSCNVDDMTAEAVGYAMEKLFEGGAHDVYTVPVGMKKNRPGTLIRVLCRPEDKIRMTELMFKHTTTIGIRENPVTRCVLTRKTETVDTKFGPVRRKVSSGYGVRQVKYEYDDVVRVAEEYGMSIQDIRKELDAL